MKIKTKTKTKMKTKTKTKTKMKNKNKNKNEKKKKTQRGAIHGAIQLSLDWPTSGIAFLLTACSPKVHFRLRIFHVA